MGLIDRIRKFFTRKNTVTIIPIGDLISIPGREYFNDREDYLKVIDDFKEEYLSKLGKIRRVTIKDISSEELINREKQSIDFLLNMIKRDDFFTYESKRLIDYRIILIKLKMQLEDIVKMEDEIVARLIALSELDVQRRVPILNRGTLKAEIDSLKISLYTLLSQKSSVRAEIDNYLTHISITDNEIKPEDVKTRKDRAIRWAGYVKGVKKLVSEEELLKEDMFKELALIAFLEMKIEEKLYNDKPDMWSLKESINHWGMIPDLNYREARPLKERIIKELEDIEDIFICYNTFGKNIVEDKYWDMLYRAKFKALTFDIAEATTTNIESRLFVTANQKEAEIYKQIISEMKSQILSGDAEVIKHLMTRNEEAGRVLIKKIAKYFELDSQRFLGYLDERVYPSLDAVRLMICLGSHRDFNNLLRRKVSLTTHPEVLDFKGLNTERGGGGTYVLRRKFLLKQL